MSERKAEPLTVSINDAAKPATDGTSVPTGVQAAPKDDLIPVRQSLLDALVGYQARRISELERQVEIKRAKVKRLSAATVPFFQAPNFQLVHPPHPPVNTLPIPNLSPTSTPSSAPTPTTLPTPASNALRVSAPAPAPIPGPAVISSPVPANDRTPALTSTAAPSITPMSTTGTAPATTSTSMRAPPTSQASPPLSAPALTPKQNKTPTQASPAALPLAPSPASSLVLSPSPLCTSASVPVSASVPTPASLPMSASKSKSAQTTTNASTSTLAATSSPPSTAPALAPTLRRVLPSPVPSTSITIANSTNGTPVVTAPSTKPLSALVIEPIPKPSPKNPAEIIASSAPPTTTSPSATAPSGISTGTPIPSVASAPATAPVTAPGIAPPVPMPMNIAHPLAQMPLGAPHVTHIPPPPHLQAANPAFAAVMAAAAQNGNTSLPLPMQAHFPFLFAPPDASLGMLPVLPPTPAPQPLPHGPMMPGVPSSSAAQTPHPQPQPHILQQPVKNSANSRANNEQSDRKQSRYWTPEEHQRFLAAVIACGPKNYGQISEFVGTRNAKQVRTHAQKFQKRLEREEAKRRGVTSLDPTAGSLSHAAAAAVAATAAAALGGSPALATSQVAPHVALNAAHSHGEQSAGAVPSDGTGNSGDGGAQSEGTARTGDGASSTGSAATNSQPQKTVEPDDITSAAPSAAAAAIAAEAAALGRGMLPADLLEGIAPHISQSQITTSSGLVDKGITEKEKQDIQVNTPLSIDPERNLSKPVANAAQSMLVSKPGAATKSAQLSTAKSTASKLIKPAQKAAICTTTNGKVISASKTNNTVKHTSNTSGKAINSQVHSGVNAKGKLGNGVKAPTSGVRAAGFKQGIPGSKLGVRPSVSNSKPMVGSAPRAASGSGKVGTSNSATTTKLKVGSNGQTAVNTSGKRVNTTNGTVIRVGSNTSATNGRVGAIKPGSTAVQVSSTKNGTVTKTGGLGVQGERRKVTNGGNSTTGSSLEFGTIASKSASEAAKKIGIANGGVTKTIRTETLKHKSASVLKTNCRVKDGAKTTAGQKAVSQNINNGSSTNAINGSVQKVAGVSVHGGKGKSVVKRKADNCKKISALGIEKGQSGREENALDMKKNEDILVDMTAAEDIVNEILGGDLSNDDEELVEIGRAAAVKKVGDGKVTIVRSTGLNKKRLLSDDKDEFNTKRRKQVGDITDVGDMLEQNEQEKGSKVPKEGDDVEAEKNSVA